MQFHALENPACPIRGEACCRATPANTTATLGERHAALASRERYSLAQQRIARRPARAV